MNEDEIYSLRHRYEQMVEEGSRAYFEPEEIDIIADSYEQDMAYDRAIEAINHGLLLYPENEMLLLRKARCQVGTGLIDEAQTTLASIAIRGIEYYFILSEIAMLSGDSDIAIESFSLIISLEESTIEDCIDILDICADLDRVDILELITPLIEGRYPDATPYLRELALLYEEKEDEDKAIELYNKILDINSFSADDWFSLAKVYARRKEYDQAIDACDFALAINESSEELVAFKGYCYYDNGRYKEAVSQFFDYLQVAADKAVAYELIAEAYARMDMHEEAVKYLLKAVELNDRSHDLYYQLAVNYYYMGDVMMAIHNLNKAIACNDNDDEAHIFLGELLLQTEQYEEAYTHLQRVDIAPLTDTVSGTALADVCIQLQRYDEAIEVLLQLITQEPYEPHYLFDIILSYMQLERYEEAAQWVAYTEELSANTEAIAQLDEKSQQVWRSIRERIDQLRNILRVYLNEEL